MHIEKNICDNVLGTLLNIDGKTKDTTKARKDLSYGYTLRFALTDKCYIYINATCEVYLVRNRKDKFL